MFPEAGKLPLAKETTRAQTPEKVKELRREASALKEIQACRHLLLVEDTDWHEKAK